MEANGTKRKIFNDAVYLLARAEEVAAPEDGIRMLPLMASARSGSIPSGCMRGNAVHLPCHSWSGNPFRLYEGERLDDMVESIREHGVLNPVIVWQNGDGYEMLAGHNRQLAENYDVTIQSKNTGHIWHIHNPEYPGEEECIIFHKHRTSHPYHQHGRARNLRQAVKSIKGHDVFQMNGRK